jgi:acylphosphatase
MQKHLNIRIYGQVQGVFFRHFAGKTARKLSVSGFAKNEPDGSVYIEAEGKDEELNQFLDWCQHGSPLASVKKVEFEFRPEIKNFGDFTME